jgi:hypothetical protein
MEMTSSTISDIRPLLRQQDLHVSVMVLEDYISLHMVFLISLAGSILDFSHRCCEEDLARNIFHGCYVLGNVVPYSRLPSNIDQFVWLPFS